MNLDEILERLGALPPDEKKALKAAVVKATSKEKWSPTAGPQMDAYNSKADCLLYGGEPGGGKSQLLLGLAFNRHKRSLIMRREYGDLDRLIEDALKLHGSRDGFNGSPPPRLRISSDQTINFRAAQRIGDEQGTMGQGRDLLGIDEATHFAESQVRFLMGWVRTEIPGQRCRTVLATNPPLTAEGFWVNSMFAPWLDPVYPYPAAHGELRWVISDADGKDEWVNGPDDVREVRGKVIRPTSRTYIPAKVKDNPFYAGGDYERQLDNMNEPWRSMLLGGFRTGFKDADFQVIPTQWIIEAEKRWRPDGFRGFNMTAMAFDPAGGGKDAAVLAYRHGGWYGPLISEKGEQTADVGRAFNTILNARRDAAPIVIDVGGGFASGILDRFTTNAREISHSPFDGANATKAKTQDGQLEFVNKRAEAWWRFREALNPDQEGGSPIALPPDPELRSDLATPSYSVGTRGILIESKDHIRKRLNRSPGKGDAVVMCLSEGTAAIVKQLRKNRPNPPTNIGYANLKRARR